MCTLTICLLPDTDVFFVVAMPARTPLGSCNVNVAQSDTAVRKVIFKSNFFGASFKSLVSATAKKVDSVKRTASPILGFESPRSSHSEEPSSPTTTTFSEVSLYDDESLVSTDPFAAAEQCSSPALERLRELMSAGAPALQADPLDMRSYQYAPLISLVEAQARPDVVQRAMHLHAEFKPPAPIPQPKTLKYSPVIQAEVFHSPTPSLPLEPKVTKVHTNELASPTNTLLEPPRPCANHRPRRRQEPRPQFPRIVGIGYQFPLITLEEARTRRDLWEAKF